MYVVIRERGEIYIQNYVCVIVRERGGGGGGGGGRERAPVKSVIFGSLQPSCLEVHMVISIPRQLKV